MFHSVGHGGPAGASIAQAAPGEGRPIAPSGGPPTALVDLCTEASPERNTSASHGAEVRPGDRCDHGLLQKYHQLDFYFWLADDNNHYTCQHYVIPFRRISCGQPPPAGWQPWRGYEMLFPAAKVSA